MNTNYKITGTPNSPVLIFSNSLGTTYHMWDEIVPLLHPYFRVLQYDTRGHGASDKPQGAYTIEMMGRDVLDLMDLLGIQKAYFCGLSMGGLIGQWLAINGGNRFYKIAVSNTAAKIGSKESWLDRVRLLTERGMSGLVDQTIDKWFSGEFQKSNVEVIKNYKEMFLSSSVSGYCSCCDAIGQADFRSELKQIRTPTLIITGNEDPVTNTEHAKFLKENIAGASLEILPGKHLVSSEVPTLFAQTLIHFFVGESSFDLGMHVRKSVLGDEHVSKSIKNTNSFNEDFQELVSNVPWGQIWTRPGLTKHQRSLITLSMMIALHRDSEFKMHIKAALNNGVTIEEIKELILQAAIYCGFPASLEAFKLSEEVFIEMEIDY